MLAVGAVQPNRSAWPHDARQPYIAVVNPGADLISSGRDGKLLTGISGTRAASALAAGAVALIKSHYPTMPWYQLIQRLVGTALPAGGRVPNDSFGYGILRLSHAVNATAYPVPADTPNPVYAKYRAWLATPQGRSVSGRLAAPSSSAATPTTSAKGGSAALPLIAVLALLAAAGAGTAALMARTRRRTVPRRPARYGPAEEPLGAPVPDLVREPGEFVPYPGLSSGGLAGGYLVLGARVPYRIPPYSPRPRPGRFPAPEG